MRKKRTYLKDDELSKLATEMIHTSSHMSLPHGYLKKKAAVYGISRATIERLWKRIKQSLENSQIVLEKTIQRQN